MIENKNKILITNDIIKSFENTNILIIEARTDEIITLSFLYSIFKKHNKKVLNAVSRASINEKNLADSDIILINNRKIFTMNEKCNLILKNMHVSYDDFPFFNIDKIKQIKQNNKVNIVFSKEKTEIIDLNCKKIIYILNDGNKFFPAKSKSEFLISNNLVDLISIKSIVDAPKILFYDYINK